MIGNAGGYVVKDRFSFAVKKGISLDAADCGLSFELEIQSTDR
jgi:hypothetical protein